MPQLLVNVYNYRLMVKSVSCFCVRGRRLFSNPVTYLYDGILNTICITDKKLLHFKLSKSSQILCVHKTGFPGPGHI